MRAKYVPIRAYWVLSFRERLPMLVNFNESKSDANNYAKKHSRKGRTPFVNITEGGLAEVKEHLWNHSIQS